MLGKNTVLDFLFHKTKSGELCVIRDSGWHSQVVYIDAEDTCVVVSPRLANAKVISDSFGEMRFTKSDGSEQSVEVHYIDI